MKERKMSRRAIEEAIKDVVETHESFYIGTAGISVMSGAIITKIDTAIMEMGLAEKAETKIFADGEWHIVRKYH